MHGELFASVNIPLGNGKYRKKRIKYSALGSKQSEAIKWALAQIEQAKTEATFNDALDFTEFAEWYKREFLQPPRFEKGLKVSGVKDFERLKNKIDRFIGFFGNRKMKDFSEYDLHRWKKTRQNENIALATINRDFALLRSMFRRGIKFRKINNIPNFDINIAAEQERDRILSFDEEKRLLAVCVAEETIEKESRRQKTYKTTINANRTHLRPIIILALDTAMRKGEILSLTWNDIDLENNQITIRAENTKAQKKRVVGITPRVKKELEVLPDKKGKVFNYQFITRSFNTACKRAGIADLHFHDLRHSAITRMIRAGIPHTEVMKISGHSQFKTFSRYLNIQADAIQSAADKLADFLSGQFR